MITVTLTTDWGTAGSYVGMFKAKLVRLLPGVQIVDISHSIPPFSVNDAVYALKPVYSLFGARTIHVVSVARSEHYEKNREFICFQYNQQYFIGPNNGLWSMLLPKEPEFVFSLNDIIKTNNQSFSESDIFSYAISKIALDVSLDSFGKKIEYYKGPALREPIKEEKRIIGTYSYFDTYGNGITNISKQVFDEVGKGRPFLITSGRVQNKTDKLYSDYEHLTDDNHIVALFNVSGFLEISIPFASLKSIYCESNTKVMVAFFDSEEEKQNFSLF